MTNSSQLTASATLEINASAFSFTPPAPGSYLLEAAPTNGNRTFPAGAPLFVTATGPGSGPLAGSLAGPQNAETFAEYFPDAVSLTGGWHYQLGFGALHGAQYPWVYHARMGWFYASGPGDSSYLVYVPGIGWCWTRPLDIYPYFYRVTDGVWFFFSAEQSTPASRWFYRFGASPGWNNVTG